MRKSHLHAPCLLLGAAALFAIPTFGRSQEQLAAKDELSKAWNGSFSRLGELFAGGEYDAKADKKHVEIFAHWSFYRLTIKYYITPSVALGKEPVEKIQSDFHTKMSDAVARGKPAFRKALGAELVGAMKALLKSRDMKTDPTTIIYACEMLPDMARLKQDEVSAYLGELAKDDKNPAVQLYALKALKETMPLVVQPDFDNPDHNEVVNILSARKARDIKTVDTLRQFIERPISTKGMAADEVKGYIFVRREAIISLAAAGAPAVLAKPDKKKPAPPDGPVAHTLLNVLAGNLTPPPTLQEKVEAAIGLCQMKYPNMPEYEPQVALYLIGKTLDEFLVDYQKDWTNFAAVGAGKKLPYIPYMGDAKRLRTALKDLSTNTPAPHNKLAKELESIMTDQKDKPLDRIIGRGDEKTRYGSIEGLGPLREWIARARPKNGPMNGKIFKTLPIDPILLPPGK